ncbi:ATP-binding cassette sub-family G member 4-like [Odontomachus brunneus]|uniref:ATP-binding cassette sub-family G member 4-like n=1 Tax=Odontomachus brunneus TaxID=486640 RepID=UPI0013F1B83D|nr:ATP-binding cassette sub-family G member 4-like [Odontomachus brunneus]XP_032683656.1 ATP-binding cassette sub-family G member 4-like [Odontomachus brunneus]
MERKLYLTNITCNQKIDVKFLDLSYAVRTRYCGSKKQILKGLNGIFRSAELTAIMGPSGAGKTMLLSILSGFQEGLYTGTVEYLKQGNKQNRYSCKKQLCYIQQTNHLHDYFTINEVMMIASYLKIDRRISRKSRQMLINDILSTLMLLHIKETRTDRLSGGEKKRLSIALEMIDNPSLMFLDEPTTGLDSSASVQCLTALKKLAQTGRTIICTIHQPSTTLYEMFDHIYLVVDGHCMYRSPPGDTVNYFARQGLQCPKYHNPADYMLEVVSKEYGNYDEQLIAASKWPESNDEICSSKLSCNMTRQKISNNNQMITLTCPPTELMRFWVLLQRYMMLTYRMRKTVYIQLSGHLFVSVLAGLIYKHTGNDANKIFGNLCYLLVSTLYPCFFGLMSAVIKFPLEIVILRKEHFNNWYQLRTCYIAILVSTIPLQTIYGFLGSSITYYMTSQPPEFSRFFMYLLINILSFFISESLGLGLGATFEPVNGFFVGSIIVCAMFSLAGLIVFFKDMTSFMYYISYLSMLRYAFDGAVQSVYGNGRENLQCSDIYCHFRAPSTILEMLDMTKSSFWYDVAILLGYYIVFCVLGYILLKIRLSRMY